MDFVDLQRRKEDRDRARRKPVTPPRSIVRDPLFLVGFGFVLGSAFSHLYLTLFYSGDPYTLFVSHPLMIFVAVVALFCYAGWLLLRSPEKTGPKPGSEKQLLMAVQDADGGITPVEAALETSLTVDEAEDILTRFADRGHLVVQSRDGALVYALPGRRHAPETRTV